MKMRKIISFVLTLALVLGSFSMAFAAAPADVVGTPNEEAVTVLMGLGVINGYPDGTYKPEGIVTRAEMAKFVVVALGLEDYAIGTSKYPDMAGATWAQGYINYATSLGIIEGYPDGTFKPSQTVSYPEVAAMIVRALGYTEGSLLPATWPANYVVKAKALGIFDDVTTSAVGANRGDVAQMMFNALTVSMVTVDSENKVTVTVPVDNMLLRLGASKGVEGVIYGNEESLINLVPYTGAYGVTYTNSDDQIVAVDVSSDAVTGTFEPSSTTATTGAGVIDESGTSNDYNVSASVAGIHVPFFWNGVEEPTSDYHDYYSIDTVTTATPPDSEADITFNVDLSGKRVEDSYGISFWVVSAADLFTADDAASIKDDKSLYSVDFILDDNDAIDLNQFVLQGAKTLSDIKTNNVVYVFEGWGDAGIKKIQVGTETVTGKVTEQDGKDWTINGKVYNLAVEKIANKGSLPTPDSFKVGDTITARLDYSGYIFDVKVDSATANKYGIKLDFAKAGVDDARAKLFTSDDATTTFNIDAKTAADDVDDLDKATKGALLAYGLNKDGKINTLDLDDTTTAAIATLSSVSVLKTANKTYAVDKDVVVFTVDGGNYDVTTIDKVKTGVNLGANVQIYVEDIYVVAMVIDANAAGKSDTDTYAVVNKVVTAIDADNNSIQRVTGFANGVAFDKYTDDPKDITLKPAVITLWNVEINADGIATAFTEVTHSAVYSAEIKSLNPGKTAVEVEITSTSAMWYAIADTAKVYVVEMSSGAYKYSLSSLSALRDTYSITLYETDADEDGYDVVIFEK